MEMASNGEKKNLHRRGKKEVMNMELYDDHSILAKAGCRTTVVIKHYTSICEARIFGQNVAT
jgi:hypothetical protein